MNKGIVMVYTGDGKGKTTAALGLSLRQVGWGKRVLVIQFMKGPGNVYGEKLAAEKCLLNLCIEQMGRDEFVNLSEPDDIDIELAQKALARAEKAMLSGECDMLVLDEVNVAMGCGLLQVSQVAGLIDKKPEHLDLVLTGRRCPEEIIEKADMVSEIKEIKHHYARGVQARKGIEY